ncbi:MAG TPA: hypothetical protein PL151_08740 [Phycisphaerae bacterium]|nr:hypothetical protein [Phycisphaerae bacterium]HOJ72686.1 hypothetical protein [Phycisphaerae bacterium]HOM49653.1 hypothetical protein [Phycisphaerae bacterium]HON65082.1 hypothetical protein [Phycisphaerae bacterium]HOQ84089.1 hypothetical protein [Phycisphaerae bacterium]
MREWRHGFGIDEHLSPHTATRERSARTGRRVILVEQLCIRLYWTLENKKHDWFFADSD